MAKRDGREVARNNELRALKALHKHGWLRTRDLAALLWMRMGSKGQAGPILEPLPIEASAHRMAQRTLARLRRGHKVIYIQAPDGSLIYGLAEAGARQLAGLGIPAKSGKDQVRRVSLSHYHHRRLANEVAILAALQGYRVASEAEISAGQWFGSMDGIKGKRPDVVVRDSKDIWLVEIERSRRNQKDYSKLLKWLLQLWPANSQSAALPNGYLLRKVVFVCENAFIDQLMADLRQHGWSDSQLASRIMTHRLLYVTEAKLLIREPKPSTGTAATSAG